jgi:indolepyruvate ferredoxin oxidoreductase
MLASARALRGTPMDPFAWHADRGVARTLAHEYAAAVEQVLQRLDGAHHEAAIEIARLPEAVSGFGPVRRRRAAEMQKRLRERLADYEGCTAPASALVAAA